MSRALAVIFASIVLLPACASAPPPGVASPALSGPSIAYRMPVVGTWRVLRTHYGAQNDQAYAVDLVVDRPDGSMFTGSGKLNREYAAYGLPIVADGPGTVIVAVDGVPENEPGVRNRYDMHGNFVVVDHHNGEYSLFCHFIPGSLQVHPGQDVVAGTELGHCGNSGHSTLPHLHWQIMNAANASVARGVPPRLLPYERNGKMTTQILQQDDVFRAP